MTPLSSKSKHTHITHVIDIFGFAHSNNIVIMVSSERILPTLIIYYCNYGFLIAYFN